MMIPGMSGAFSGGSGGNSGGNPLSMNTLLPLMMAGGFMQTAASGVKKKNQSMPGMGNSLMPMLMLAMMGQKKSSQGASLPEFDLGQFIGQQASQSYGL